MLFTKKKVFSLTEKQIKKDILSPDGEVILKINLRYPQLNCPKGDPLLQNAAPFYERFAESLLYYAERDLKEEALKNKGSEPHSVYLRWESPFCDEKYLSVLLEVGISLGDGQLKCQRKAQVWERKFGTKCTLNEFFTKERQRELKREMKEKYGDGFDIQLFLKDSDGYSFYIPSERGFLSVSVSA